MPKAPASELRLLDHCLTDREALKWIRNVLDKLDKCCQAVDRQMNLGEIVSDPGNQKSLAEIFGPEGFELGIQLLLKLALKDHHSHSFTIHADLEGERKLDFLHRSVAGWKQFDMVVQIAGEQPLLINPKRPDHWKKIESVKAGTLVTIHLKTTQGKRVRADEQLAGERFLAIVETVLSNSQQAVTDPAAEAPPKPVTTKAIKPPPFRRPMHRTPAFTTAGPPVMELQVTINKIDTFVHAGNAHLIMNLLKEYHGKVNFYVLRDTKKKIGLDADSIWAAEIRNGETVLYEFFGPKPSPQFLKELARTTNKYTQMDKVANE